MQSVEPDTLANSEAVRALDAFSSISSSARGVGCMPDGVRTNSGSCSSLRSLASQMLTVGCDSPSCSALRVTLCVL